MDDCIFCKIIKGEIPSAKVYEDDDVYAFLDIAPVNPGHALVIPKKHFIDLEDIPEEDLKTLMPVTKELALAIVKSFAYDGFNLMQNNGRAAGQLVDHFHIHIIPRKEGDYNYKLPQHSYTAGKMEEVRTKIIKAL